MLLNAIKTVSVPETTNVVNCCHVDPYVRHPYLKQHRQMILRVIRRLPKLPIVKTNVTQVVNVHQCRSA